MKFEPKNNHVELEIKDNIFIIDPMAAQAKAEEIQELLKSSIAGKENTLVNDAILKDMTSSAKKCIDLLLGKGTSDKLFTEKDSYYDVMDVYFFITENVNKKCAEKNAEYKDKK
ncbi:MAG: hypothetical protein J6R66_01510 [Clostridia bacterium]|nr:hypothetical protein [Clostridia bacterium]